MAPLSDTDLRFFQNQGYLVLSGLFDSAECEQFRRAIDALMADRAAKAEKFVCEYPRLGPLIADERVLTIVEQLMGSGFAFHHLHAVRQDAGAPGVPWHQDYEQCPHTNRKHVMAHLFYYFNGLNGTIGDLLLLPGSQRTIVDNGALGILGDSDLPGSIVVDNLPPGSAVIVHSALWHARRAKPGGDGRPRYFADASYCQAGVVWPAYGNRRWREILARCREIGLDANGKRAHLFDEAMFFDYLKARSVIADMDGSLLLKVPGWEECPN